MSALTNSIEREIAAVADLAILVEESDGALVLTGMVRSDGERQAAIDIAVSMADGLRIEDNIEASGAMPGEVGDYTISESEAGSFAGAREGLSQSGGLEAGDFTDQELDTDPVAASGAGPSWEDDVVSEGAEAYVPPIDPVGTTREVIGGFETSSMDDVPVARSEYGGLSDDSIADAIRRELREDSATSDLDIQVHVRDGMVHLRGKVMTIDDAENAEAVASRVPGVKEVRELLDVEAGRLL
jgi:osmotically-inducible protein OsmY